MIVPSTGLLDHLIRAHSDASITVACGPVAEGGFARMPDRERIAGGAAGSRPGVNGKLAAKSLARGSICRAVPRIGTWPVPGAASAIFAGPGETERAIADLPLAALPEAIDLMGRPSLPEVAACLAHCKLFVGNDSELMHLAPQSACRHSACSGRRRPRNKRLPAFVAAALCLVAQVVGISSLRRL